MKALLKTRATTKFILLQPLIFFCAINAPVLCAPAPSAEMDSVKIYLIGQRYDAAAQTVKKILSENPGNIEALYLGSAIRQTAILDYESYAIDGERTITLAESTFSAVSRRLHGQKGKDSIDCLFYMGSILGGQGVVKGKTGNWPGAIKNAFASVNYFKQTLSLDSTYYAGYFGIGVYNYYLSKQLKWLPFFGDKRAEAIAQLQKATRAPFPYDYIARNSLCWIHIERNELDQADSLASSVLSKYPDNTLFIRIKIRIDLAKRRWPQAITGAGKLVSLSSGRTPVNWADIVSGYQAMVFGYEQMKKRGESLKAAGAVLSLPIPEEFRKIPFVKRHLKYVAEIRKKYSGL
jgi:tetratricopeptide (TPR) repeat protein